MSALDKCEPRSLYALRSINCGNPVVLVIEHAGKGWGVCHNHATPTIRWALANSPHVKVWHPRAWALREEPPKR